VSRRTAAHLVGGVEERLDVAAGDERGHRGEQEVEGAVGDDGGERGRERLADPVSADEFSAAAGSTSWRRTATDREERL
jgi:hypothetical protein